MFIDKSKKKLDSPDLSQTPTHFEHQDDVSVKIIDGEDIQALAIKEEDLQRVLV